MIANTATRPVEYTPAPVRAPPRLVAARRCVCCASDDAEPIGVGEDFDAGHSPETFLAVRCAGCGLVYLALRPADPAEWQREPDPGSAGLERGVRRQLAVLARMLPRDGCALEIGCGDGRRLCALRELLGPRWTIEGAEAVAPADAAEAAGFHVHRGDVDELDPECDYDLVLITDALARHGDPVGLLSAAASRLRPGGRVVIVVENTDTACFRLFAGRHWAGYHFPRRWYCFDARTLSSLVARAGLRVSYLDSAADADLWVRSIRNVIADYRPSSWLAKRCGPTAVVAPALLRVVEAAEHIRGHGALLVAACRRAE